MITNYNFGRYIGDAIRSALDLRWPDMEIVVCGDGSTENSRDVIKCFGSHIKSPYKANGGQATAGNAACPLTNSYQFLQEPIGPLIRDGITAVLIDPSVNRKTKLIITMWFLVVGLCPRRAALWAIKAPHVPLSLPRIGQFVLSLAGAVRS